MDDRGERNATGVTANRRATTAPGAERLEAADGRLQRLDDLMATALTATDPLRSNLLAAVDDLLGIGCRLSAAIGTAMDTDSDGVQAYALVQPAINSLALVHRQAARFVQLERERAARESADRGAL